MMDDELKRHFAMLGTAIERVEARFDLLAESIANLDEKLERRTTAIEQRMERGFAETQAMVRVPSAR